MLKIKFFAIPFALLCISLSCQNVSKPVGPDDDTWAPVLISPADGSITINRQPTFHWDTLESVTAYRLQIAQDSLFAAIACSVDTIDTQIALNTQLDFQHYFWRIGSLDENADIMCWSTCRSFRIVEKDSLAPQLLEPANHHSTENRQPTLIWHASATEAYTVQVASDSLFSSVLMNENIADTTIVFPYRLLNGNYFWRVGNKNTKLDSVVWSDIWQFEIFQIIELQNILIFPENDLIIYKPFARLKCKEVEEIHEYITQIANDSLFADMVEEITGIDVIDLTAGVRTKSLSPGKYYWRVQGADQNKVVKYVSEPRHFTMKAMPEQMEMAWVRVDQNLTISVNDQFISEHDTTIVLEPYEIGKYEVSILQYCIYLNQEVKDGVTWSGERRFNPPLFNGTPFEPTWRDANSKMYYPEQGAHNKPIFRLTWFGAKAFADYYGWEIPSHAEWLRAAKGPNFDRTWPWGEDAPTCEYLHYKSCLPINSTWQDFSAVDSHPLGQSYEGCFNMAGNVKEYTGEYFETFGPVMTNLNGIVRGGSCWGSANSCTTNSVYYFDMFELIGGGNGLRVVRHID